MDEEKVINATENQEADSNLDYIEAIKEMKRTTVSRSDYEALQAEKKKLVQALVNGQSYDDNKPAVEGVARENELRNKLFKDGGHMNNLEYITTVCDLRDQLIENGKPDPFVPVGSKYTPTDEDYITAQRVADNYRACIDYADGDPQVFQSELMRRTVDVNASNIRRGY